jgi:hypothetical protein
MTNKYNLSLSTPRQDLNSKKLYFADPKSSQLFVLVYKITKFLLVHKVPKF